MFQCFTQRNIRFIFMYNDHDVKKRYKMPTIEIENLSKT